MLLIDTMTRHVVWADIEDFMEDLVSFDLVCRVDQVSILARLSTTLAKFWFSPTKLTKFWFWPTKLTKFDFGRPSWPNSGNSRPSWQVFGFYHLVSAKFWAELRVRINQPCLESGEAKGPGRALETMTSETHEIPYTRLIRKTKRNSMEHLYY